MTAPPLAQTTKSGRLYRHPVTDELQPSVTTVVNGVSSSAGLVSWSAGMAAEYALDRLPMLAQLVAEGERQAALELVKGAPDRYRDARGDRGDRAHGGLEALTLWASTAGPGSDVPLPVLADDVAPLVDYWLEWVTSWHVTFEAAELQVFTPGPLGYGGQVDALAYVPPLGPGLWGLDYKSGRSVDPAKVALQGTAYRYARQAFVSDPTDPRATPDGWLVEPMPELAGFAVVHLTDAGLACLPLDTGPEALEAWQHARALFEWNRTRGRRSVGRRVRRPGEAVPLADYTGAPHGRACRALEKAGVTTVQQLAALTVDELLALPGVGPGTAAAVDPLLAEHGLALRAVEVPA